MQTQHDIEAAVERIEANVKAIIAAERATQAPHCLKCAPRHAVAGYIASSDDGTRIPYRGPRVPYTLLTQLDT